VAEISCRGQEFRCIARCPRHKMRSTPAHTVSERLQRVFIPAVADRVATTLKSRPTTLPFYFRKVLLGTFGAGRLDPSRRRFAWFSPVTLRLLSLPRATLGCRGTPLGPAPPSAPFGLQRADHTGISFAPRQARTGAAVIVTAEPSASCDSLPALLLCGLNLSPSSAVTVIWRVALLFPLHRTGPACRHAMLDAVADGALPRSADEKFESHNRANNASLRRQAHCGGARRPRWPTCPPPSSSFRLPRGRGGGWRPCKPVARARRRRKPMIAFISRATTPPGDGPSLQSASFCLPRARMIESRPPAFANAKAPSFARSRAPPPTP